MKDLGEAKRILGMEIERDKVKEKMSLTQKAYLPKALQKFDVWCETKSVSNPLTPHFKLSANMSSKVIDEREYMSHVSYVSAAGSPMYAMMCKRTELSQPISMISRYIHDPSVIRRS